MEERKRYLPHSSRQPQVLYLFTMNPSTDNNQRPGQDQPIDQPEVRPIRPPQPEPAVPPKQADNTPASAELNLPETAPPAEDSPAPSPEEQAPSERPEVEWQASEYIHHEKGTVWFAALAAITVAAAGGAAFFQQWVFAVLIVVMGVALGVFARRPPREVHYRVSSDGISVGERTFPFSQFRAFGVLDEGAFYSVQLRPAKRFMPGVSIFFAEENGEKIFDALAARLPMETIQQDPVDKFMRWLRF